VLQSNPASFATDLEDGRDGIFVRLLVGRRDQLFLFMFKRKARARSKEAVSSLGSFLLWRVARGDKIYPGSMIMIQPRNMIYLRYG
jgi:hypothetical protein